MDTSIDTFVFGNFEEEGLYVAIGAGKTKMIHPDFTVLHVKERRQIYWEHRGMMDDKDYATRSVLRIKNYMKNGIFIGHDLIITEETSANPLGTNEIDAVIAEHFKKL